MRPNFKRRLAPSVAEVKSKGEFTSAPLFTGGVRWSCSFSNRIGEAIGDGCSKREAIASVRRQFARARGEAISNDERAIGRINAKTARLNPRAYY
jgi:hypothetical protein